MFEINVCRVVDCPVEETFRFLCDLENDPQWWIGVREVRRTSAVQYAAGATYWQRNVLFGLSFDMTIEVTQLDWCERMEFRSTSTTLAPFVCTYLFEPQGAQTKVTMFGRSEANGFAFRLLGPLFRSGLRQTAESNFDRLQHVLAGRGRRISDLSRISAALTNASALITRCPPEAADITIDRLLREMLPRGDEGWLSEETPDDGERLGRDRVWIVDPLDGTREFRMGLPEWSISIALVEGGRPVAAGVCNPAACETIVGALGHGVTRNGKPASVSTRATLAGATILASRSEVSRGIWEPYAHAPYSIRPLGSVAYKLALVAAGAADATWTTVPKHEWDVAAGVGLVLAAGGRIVAGSPAEERFNRRDPKLTRLIAAPPQLMAEITREVGVASGKST